jgi:hypothetical protein
MKIITKLFFSFVLILLFSFTEFNAQSFDTGTMGVEVNDFGRVRVHSPAIGTRQIDRSSILVGISSSNVFDYGNDADSEVPPTNILTPLLSDYQITGSFNNNVSNAAPDVLVDLNVYGWTNGAYAILQFTVQNLEASMIDAVIGIEILPQVDGAYGDETCAYNSTNGTAYFSKTTYVGYKLLSSSLAGVKFVTWSSGYNTDANLWSWLTYNSFDASYLPGADGAVAVMAQNSVQINPGETAEIYFAVAVGSDESSLYANIAEAENKYNTVLPVELTSFTANVVQSGVELNWTTATELNNLGFEIQRKIESQSDSWQTIAFLDGQGTINEITNYEYLDNLSSIKSDNILYRLKQIDFSGQFEYSDIIEVHFNPIPEKFILNQNYPNPFNPATKISFGIPETGNVVLKLFNSLGEELATLINENMEAGNYDINLSADEYGMTSGIYFYTLQSGSSQITKKMILMK